MKLTVIGAGTAAVGLYGIGRSGKVDYSDPAYLYWNKNTRGALNLENYLVLCGSLAPSAHNTQPWKFDIADKKIGVFADIERNLGQADKHRRMMLMSIGCAVENICVAAGHLGVDANVTLKADSEFHTTGLCAHIDLAPREQPREYNHFESIFNRQTTRAVYLDEPVAESLKFAIEALNNFPFLSLYWFDSPCEREALNNLQRAAVKTFVGSEPTYRDSLAWWRYSRDEILRKRDGISIFTSGAPALIKQYFQYTVDRQDMIGDFGKQGEIEIMDQLFESTPLWGAITSQRRTNAARLQAGQMLERVYLEATYQGYRIMPVAYIPEQASYANRFKTLFNIPADNELVCVYRIGKAPPCEKSVRRALKDIIV